MVAACVSLASCDRSASPGSADSRTSAVITAKPVFGTGTIRGIVKFIGTPPPQATIANQPCHPGASALKDETVIVNGDGTLANVLLSLQGIAPSTGAEQPKVKLDQKDCRYVPHVVGLQIGQPLDVKSSDETMHNVHYLSSANPPGNFAMVHAGDERTLKFDQPEVITFKCDVHPWMTAYVGVFDNPFFAVSSTTDGHFEIARVPAGVYKLHAWHERYGELDQPVTVKDGQTVNVVVTYQAG